MTLNFQQVFDKIKQIGVEAQARQEKLDALRERASLLLDAWADKAAELGPKVERASRAVPSLCCALPLEEPLNAHLQPGPASTAETTLIAADGSQVVPDRHAPVLYGLINVGAVIIPKGPKDAPQVLTDSNLSFNDEVATWTESLVALRRDLAERKKLLELSRQYPLPVVTLTDGPLQLWESHESDEVIGYEKALEDYRDILSQLQKGGVITAGYVDKPASNLVVRLLEVAITPENEFDQLRNYHPLSGVTDLWLFNQILRSRERSAIFALQAPSKAIYRGPLALHFFYLNVGQPGHPRSVRVEIPAWVDGNKSDIDLLHTTLLEQSAIMGAKPYPYILHRAHEMAVVTFQEKQQIEQMLAIELRRSGGEVGEKSAKQTSKDSSHAGKKRFR
ncbi:MAG: DNA double-strand break repair nuclease NurA [Candidatus Villigracilaceae bacterium]